jgi:hypothetical protein
MGIFTEIDAVLQAIAAQPYIYNIAIADPDTEYSLELPSGTKAFAFSIQDGAEANNFRIAFETGKVATPTPPFLKYSCIAEYAEKGLYLNSKELFFACSVGAVVAQIIVWI